MTNNTNPLCHDIEAARTLTDHAWAEYAKAVELIGELDTARMDLEKHLEIAALIGTGRTTPAFDELVKLDTVVRDNIPREVWQFILSRKAII